MKRLLAQLQAGERLDDRRNFNGHITGSALVVSPDRSQLLVVHHKLFDKWLQPGGHWETDEPNPWLAARREAEEETGVRIAEQLLPEGFDETMPLFIGTFPIPARPEKDEPPHVHHDLRYAFLAADAELTHRAEEVHAAEWFSPDDPRLEWGEVNIRRLRHFKLLR